MCPQRCSLTLWLGAALKASPSSQWHTQDLISKMTIDLNVNPQIRRKSGYVHMAGPVSKHHLALSLIQCRPHNTNRSFNAISQHEMHLRLTRSGEDRQELKKWVWPTTEPRYEFQELDQKVQDKRELILGPCAVQLQQHMADAPKSTNHHMVV